MNAFRRKPSTPGRRFCEARVRAHIELDQWLDGATATSHMAKDSYSRGDVIDLGLTFSAALIDAWNIRPRTREAAEEPVVTTQSGKTYKLADVTRILEAMDAAS